MTPYQIKTFSKANLAILAEDPQFWQDPHIPFDRMRLQQYLDNPYAADDDILWLFASTGQKIVAYLGMVPDLILLQGKQSKISWLSSWWVDPAFRGTGLGDALIRHALELNPRAAVNSGTPISVGKVLKYHQMHKYGERLRSFYLLNLNASILHDFGYRNALLHKILPPLQGLIGGIMKLRIKAWQQRIAPARIKVEYLASPDAESLSFLDSFWQQEFSLKTAEAFNWRTHNLALSPRLKGICPLRKTYFGNPGYAQQNLNLKLIHDGEMIAYLNLVISDGVLRLPYFYLKEGNEERFISWLANVVCANGIQALYSQHPGFVALLKRFRFPHLFHKSYLMPVVVSQALQALQPGKIVQDGDGAF